MEINLSEEKNLSDFFQPAEWAEHESCWLAWPSHSELWQENLIPAQTEFIAFCEAICDLDPKTKLPRGERIDLLVPFDGAKTQAQQLLKHLPVTYHEIPFGDIWLRDTAPIFLKTKAGNKACVQFLFNGWGGKYNLPHDNEVATRMAAVSGVKSFSDNWIFEGGSIEVDGQGTALTTRQCLLNPNRNSRLTTKEIEYKIKDALGIKKLLWLNEGLVNDHTDGHIDTLARFYAPGKVVIMKAQDRSDPNYECLKKIETELRGMTDAQGRALEIHTITSPGSVVDENERVMPASYLNFYISNTCVIVPTYGNANDEAAVAALSECFPTRKTIGLSALAILSGGGAFHCISQQEPK